MRTTHISVFGILLLFGGSLLLPEAAPAKQCVPAPFEDSVKEADVIFEGTVIKREPYDTSGNESICWKQDTNSKELCGGKLATFLITQVWKGAEAGNIIQAYSEDACYCLGNYFEKGKKYIVFARKAGGASGKSKGFVTANSVCLGSMPSENNPLADDMRKQLDRTFGK